MCRGREILVKLVCRELCSEEISSLLIDC